ncbi:MAG: hypothetical protein J1F11_03250 [Oscillospiraceae bacterium]|nr:hypothetical protein [Oscillospiraceae bacterium]
MNENKRREWVKNAIIIFLIIMLLLTFFSNTIMNYSLPEVSAKYVESGTLSEQIRGTGEVKANQTYELKMGETRKIASVEVKAGDTVEKGQVIYKLEDNDSAELTAAEKTLRAAKKSYEEALLSVGYDYRADELDIEKQEEDIALLKAELPKISEYSAAYDKAKEKVRGIESEIKNFEKDIKDLEKDIKEYNDVLTVLAAEDYASLSAEDYAKITKAKADLEKAEKTKKDTEDKIAEYEGNIAAGGNQSAITAAKRAIEEKEMAISKVQQELNDEYMKENPDYSVINSLKSTLEQYELDLKYLKEDYDNVLSESAAYSSNKQKLNAEKTTLEMNNKKYDAAKKALEDIIASIKQDAKSKADAVQNKIDGIQDKIDDANIRLEDAKAELAEAEKKSSLTKEEQETKIRDAENALEKSKIALSQKQRSDAVTAGKDALNIQELQAAVDDAEDEVERLKKNSVGAEITAPVGGKIAALSFSAGEEAARDSVAASIEMTEKGYTLEITASVEQSKKVRVGDEADIEYFYYGDASAKLLSITPDTSNPARSRILTFSVTGDVAPGQSLNIAMGSKGQRYEYIVPNSAVREDNNGKFVLAVRSKSSPLGNRYMAERINVEVLASDDTSSAISGDIMNGDFIITISTAPIDPGDQVRLESK